MLNLGSAKELDLQHTLQCGQCFRWRQGEDGCFYGVAGGRAARAWSDGGEVFLEASEESPEFWRRYFGLAADYAKIAGELRRDVILKKCIEHGYGIRILYQDMWETIISFICSANNNIPRIEKIIDKLCTLFGERIEWNGKEYFSFPTAKRLAELECEDLAPLRAGYRDKYIIDTARAVASGEADLESMRELPTAALRKELCRLSGVGPKVADCIMLFGMGRYEVFPKDVWTKRILQETYKVENGREDEFVRERFGRYAGIAQQYLYYYFRETS